MKGIKPDLNKVQGNMDITTPTTKTEAQAIISVVQYYRDMWTRRSHILGPLKEAYSGLKCGNILWADALKDFFK